MVLSKRKTTFMSSENNHVFSSDTPKYHLWCGASQDLTLYCFLWITCTIQRMFGFLKYKLWIAKMKKEAKWPHIPSLCPSYISKFDYISLILIARCTLVKRNNSRTCTISDGFLFNIWVHINLSCFSNYCSIVTIGNS